MPKQDRQRIYIFLTLAVSFLLAVLVMSCLIRTPALSSASGSSLTTPANHLSIGKLNASTNSQKQSKVLFSKAFKRVKRSTTMCPRIIQPLSIQLAPTAALFDAVLLRKKTPFEILSLRALRKTVLLR